jgi:RHS repeat-associated protein
MNCQLTKTRRMNPNVAHMKKIVRLFTILFWLTLLPATGQNYTISLSSSSNYIHVITPEGAMKSVPENSVLRDINSIDEEVQYFDGLGRPLQSISVKASPLGNDIIQPYVYDGYGRESNKYLPYTLAGNNGALVTNPITDATKGQKVFYESLFTGEGNYARSHTVFESSPLNRVLEQGAPGAAWQPADETGNSSGHTNKIEYGTNVADDVLMMAVDDSGNLTYGTSGGDSYNSKYYYTAGTLYKMITKDENWNKKLPTNYGITTEFKDKDGKLLLKRSYDGGYGAFAETYYVYDDYGLLRYVLSPMATTQLILPLSSSSDLIKKLCYYYEYDTQQRMVVKQLPGSNPVYMVYDYCNRLALTQDGNQRVNNQWMFTRYDSLNRPVVSGTFSPTSSLQLTTRTAMQNFINNVYDNDGNMWETRNNTGTTGYTEIAFPRTAYGTLTYLTATFYDTYGFPGLLAFDESNTISTYSDSQGNTNYMDLPRGQVTGTRTKVLGSSTWLNATNYYDDRYHAIQLRHDLYDGSNGGKETVSSNYDFTGKLTDNRQYRTFGSDIIYYEKYYTYDHAGRLINLDQQIYNGSFITISQMTYNELGQLKRKGLHSIDNSTPVQTVDYTYNIRGWLSGINDPDSLGTDLFGEKLFYNTTDPASYFTFSQLYYNGDISLVEWRYKGKAKQEYQYYYDLSNRLSSSDYSYYTSDGWRGYDSYSEFPIYDLNGNISYLVRTDVNNDGTFNAEYTYSGNHLVSLYNNWTDETFSYTYDANGNTTYDGLRGFNISYNTLNLPSVLSKGDDNLSYIYSASGEKLAKVMNGEVQQYYAGNMVYNNSKALDYIIHDEGLVKRISRSFTYEYYLKDHLGNIRTVFNSSGSVEQETDYYPFGLAFQNNNLDVNKYLYNGKELQDETLDGTFVGMYDYETRQYDPARAGWNSPDPMAETTPGISPYAYCFNNPISHNDPTGMFGENTNNAWTSTFIKPDGTVLEHRDDHDPRVYLVEDEEAWKKGGKKKDGLSVVGFEDPNKNYKPGDQYTYYNPAEDPNYKGDYLIPAEAYDYNQAEIEGKFSQDWAYIIYGDEGNGFSRWWNTFSRDASSPENRSTVISAGIDVIPYAGGIFKVVKGAKYVGEIGGKFIKFEKVVKASNLKGEARAVYVQIFNKQGKLVKMYKDTYRIDGRLLHRRMLKPNEPIYRK